MIRKRTNKPSDIRTPLNRQENSRGTIKQRFQPMKRKIVDDLEDFIEMPNKKEDEAEKENTVRFAALGGLEEIGRNKKIEVIKYKQKSRYFKNRGHRQPFFKVKITSLK